MLMSRKQRQHGVEVVTDAMLGEEAHDNFTCAHCGNNERIKPMKVVGNVMTDENVGTVYDRCSCCNSFICIECMKVPNCVVLERRIQFWEDRARCST